MESKIDAVWKLGTSAFKRYQIRFLIFWMLRNCRNSWFEKFDIFRPHSSPWLSHIWTIIQSYNPSSIYMRLSKTFHQQMMPRCRRCPTKSWNSTKEVQLNLDFIKVLVWCVAVQEISFPRFWNSFSKAHTIETIKLVSTLPSSPTEKMHSCLCQKTRLLTFES